MHSVFALSAALGGRQLLFRRTKPCVGVAAAAAAAAAVGGCLPAGAISAFLRGVLYCGLRSATVHPEFAAAASSAAAVRRSAEASLP